MLQIETESYQVSLTDSVGLQILADRLTDAGREAEAAIFRRGRVISSGSFRTVASETYTCSASVDYYSDEACVTIRVSSDSDLLWHWTNREGGLERAQGVQFALLLLALQYLAGQIDSPAFFGDLLELLPERRRGHSRRQQQRLALRAALADLAVLGREGMFV